jgi:hypothetical protein
MAPMMRIAPWRNLSALLVPELMTATAAQLRDLIAACESAAHKISGALSEPPQLSPNRAGPDLTDGERWCQIELTRLIDAGWHPVAWRRFIRAGFTRADVNRRRHPIASARARRWIAVGTGAWLLLARGRPDGPFAAAGRGGLVWWAVCGAMLDWHLGMLETEAGEAINLNGADALTLLRAWLVPAVAMSPTPGLLLLGGLTDIGDGHIARATRATRWGRDLEGIVDACFTVAALHGAARAGMLSRPALWLERARLTAGLGYISSAYFGDAKAPDRVIPRSARRAAPVRFAALIAAGSGRRRLADRLLLASTAIAVGALAAAR